MPRYIDADALMQKYCNECGVKDREHFCRAHCGEKMIIENMPTADVELVRHGRWIRGKNKSAFPAKPPAIWYCSCCGEMIRYNDTLRTYQKSKKPVNEVNPRCRKCGAKMDESGGKNNGKNKT